MNSRKKRPVRDPAAAAGYSPVAVPDDGRHEHPICPRRGPLDIAVDGDKCEHPICPDYMPEPVVVDGDKSPHPLCF